MAAEKKPAKASKATGAAGNGKHGPEKWRILIFMATETESLIEPAKADLLELLTVRNLEGVSVYVHVHGFQIEPPQLQGSQCYTIGNGLLNRGCDGKAFASKADGDTLAKDLAAIGFASNALKTFVRKHVHDLLPDSKTPRVALILWGHSQGVAEAITGPPAKSPFRARPFTYAGASSAEIAEALADALTKHGSPPRKLDLLVFDSCFMGAVEVVAEFYNIAEYLVASQVTVELPALQLASVLEAAKETKDPADLGHKVVSQAADSSSGTRSLTLFRPSKAWSVPPVRARRDNARSVPPAEPFEKLATELHRGVRHASLARHIFEAFHDTPFREVRQFLDLRRLTRALTRIHSNHKDDPQIATAARDLHDALHPAQDGFIVKVCERDERARFGGVSVYCPWFQASRAELRAGFGDALVDSADYLRLLLVAGRDEKNGTPPNDSWGHLMLGLAHAWRLGRADGAADGVDACDHTCPCCGQIADAATAGPDVRTGGPKDPKLGPFDDDIA